MNRSIALLAGVCVLLLNITAHGQVINEVCADNENVLSPGGTRPDYVEIYNPGNSSVTLSNWFLTDDPTKPQKWAFPNNASIPARGHVMVWLDETNHYSGLISTNFSLRDSGEIVELYQGTTKRDSIVFGPQLKDYTLGRYPSGGALWTLGTPSPGQTNKSIALGTPLALRINEIMATNSAGDDWLELYNPSTNGPVHMGGMVLCDTNSAIGLPALWTNGFIKSGGFQVFTSGSGNRGDHMTFKLSSTSGDTVYLYASNRTALVDMVSFGPQERDLSYGRLPDGGAHFFVFSPTNRVTPGDPNDYLPITEVVVNEVLTHTDFPLEDAVELYNTTEHPVDISYWWLSNSKDRPLKFRIPPGTVIPPFGYKVFFEQVSSPAPGFNQTGTGNFPDFTFNSAHGDDVVLTAGSETEVVTGYQSARTIPASANGVAFTRYVKSNGGTDLVPESVRTFGNDNPPNVGNFRASTGLPNAYPLVGPLVISEIMYSPPDVIVGGQTNDNVLDEYIELTSVAGSPLPLYDPAYPTNTWHVGGGVVYRFPRNVTVPPLGSLLLVNFDPVTNSAQLAAFRSKYQISPSVPLFGPYEGKLKDSEDEIILFKPDPVQLPPSPDAGYVPAILVEKVKYDNTNGWTLEAKATGRSLQRVSLSGYANDQTNWVAANPNPGTVIAAPEIISQPSTVFVVQGQQVVFSVEATGSAPLSFQWRFNGTPISGANQSSYTIASAQQSDIGSYDVVVTNKAGSVTSSAAFMLVLVPPYFIAHPTSQSALPGDSVTFGVYVGGTEPLSYQWQFAPPNGEFTDLPGKTESSLQLENVQAANSGSYRVVVNNFAGQAVSDAALLSVTGAAPEILGQPQNHFVAAGATVTLSVQATGTTPVMCQWRKDGQPLAGDHSPSLLLSNVQTNQSGYYDVILSNSFGSVTSVVALVSVAAPPHLLSVEKLDNGSTSILLDGKVGHTYELQGTTNYSDWTVVKRFTNTLGREAVSDLSATNLPFRVYRGVLTP